MTTTQNAEDLIGTVVVVKRVDRVKAFSLRVDRVEHIDGVGDMLIGLLPSKKYPGDFYGQGWAWTHEIIEK